jgi:hypothetical protein
MTETSHFELPTHRLKAQQVRSKLVSKEGHSTLEAETVFPLNLVTLWRGVIETAHRALPACWSTRSASVIEIGQ